MKSTQWKLGTLVAAGALLAVALIPAKAGAQSPAMRFGMDIGSIDAQAQIGAKPDYAMVWIGPWNLKSGWADPDKKFDQAYAAGVTPAVQFYYWGDDISPQCLEEGCYSSLHATRKDKAGWDDLSRQLVQHLDARMKGRPVLIILETEFNKGGAQTYEPLDGYLAAKSKYFKDHYPNAKTVMGLGNWGREHWGTFDRTAAAVDYTGIQGMRASTRNSIESYEALASETIAGIKVLKEKFGKPIIITDIALSSHPEPDYLSRQAKTLGTFFGRMGELKSLGVHAILYRGFYDSPTMDTKNYFGEAERHWGIAWAANKSAKPAQKVWVDGVKRERGGASTPPPPPPATTSTGASPPPLAPAPAGSVLVATADFNREAEQFGRRTTGTVEGDATASGGNRLNMKDDGEIAHTFTAPQDGRYSVIVWAAGEQFEGAPHMVVTLDGRKLLEADPGTKAWTAYRATTSLGAGPHELKIAYTNDRGTLLDLFGERNLWIDRAVVQADAMRQAEAFEAHSSGQRESDATASGGARWNLWSNGHVAQRVKTSGGSYDLTVRAQGQLCAYVSPHMRILVDGVVVTEVDVPSGWHDETVRVPLSSGEHEIRIEFTNDAMDATGDRNLLLDKLGLARVA